MEKETQSNWLITIKPRNLCVHDIFVNFVSGTESQNFHSCQESIGSVCEGFLPQKFFARENGHSQQFVEGTYTYSMLHMYLTINVQIKMNITSC